MATPPPTPPPRRLTLRELQDRKREADEAFAACKVLFDRLNEEHDAIHTGSWPQLVAQFDARRLLLGQLEGEMQEPLAVIRGALPSNRLQVREERELRGRGHRSVMLMWRPNHFDRTDTTQLATVLLSWSTFFAKANDHRRSMPMLREAIDVLTPPTTRDEQEMLANCMATLGNVFQDMGWLAEARANLLESLAVGCNARPMRTMVLIELAKVQVQMGRLVEALESARAIEQALGRGGIPVRYRAHTLLARADVFEAVGQEEKCQRIATALAGEVKADGSVDSDSRYRTRMAKELLREGRVAAAEMALELKLSLGVYEGLLRMGLLPGHGMNLTVKLLRVGVDILRAIDWDERAALLEADLDETDAIIKCYNETAVDEVMAELRAERAAAAAGSGGGASASSVAPVKKKPSRKQQKRKAAQRRKAEERAAEAAAAAAAAVVDGEEEVMVVAVAVAQVQIDTTAAAPEIEPAPEPEEEPEEYAMCLNDLPPSGADGGVLLGCSHTFHAECLGRWKAKCLEKGLRFTCPMCRGAVLMVAAGGAGEGMKTK